MVTWNLRVFPGRTFCGLIVLIFICKAGIVSPAEAGQWPQWLGPDRNGVYSGPPLAETWPQEGPPIVWRKEVGQGFSGPVVSGGRLVLFHRLGDKETVDCLGTHDGKRQWRHAYPTDYRDDFGFDEGPRATPTIDGNRVYTLGAQGNLHCLELATGEPVWEVDTRKAYDAPKGFFGMVCSPLVTEGAVLVNIGGEEGAGIVAFDRITGKTLWKATDDEASYSSPVAATIHGETLALFFTRSGLVAVHPEDGRVAFEHPWRSSMHASVNAATPLVNGDEIFLSASYQTGAILLKVQPDNSGVNEVWSGDRILSNHYATSVYHEGCLYGYDGRQEYGPRFRCVDWADGEVHWSRDGFGAGTVTLAGDRLLILKETGQLLMAAASPKGYRELARAQILPFEVRAYPALADGRLYARSKKTLVCVDLR